MKVSYERGDMVNIIAGPHARKSGTIYCVKENMDGVPRLVINVMNGTESEKVEVTADKVIPDNGLAVLFSALYENIGKYYYALDGKPGYWAFTANGKFVSLGNKETDVYDAMSVKICSSISIEVYDKFKQCEIPFDGSEFWIYDTARGLYRGPVHFAQETIRTKAGGYVELKESFKAMSFDEVVKANTKDIVIKKDMEVKKTAVETVVKTCDNIVKKAEAAMQSFVDSSRKYQGDNSINEQIYNEYENGVSPKELAKKYDMGISTVYKRIQKHKVSLSTQRRAVVENIDSWEHALKLHNDGMSYSSIAKKFGVTKNVAVYRIKKAEKNKAA